MEMPLENLQIDLVAACQEDSVFTETLQQRGIRIHQLSGSTRNLPKNWQMFRQLLRQEQYDVVYLNLFQGLGLYYGDLARQEGVAVRIVHSHNSDLRPSMFRRLKLLLHQLGCWLFRDVPTHFWACSRSAAEFLFGKNAAWKFVPNGIDTVRFSFDPHVRQQLREQLDWTDCFVLGHVGRLCTQKNQAFLMDVLAALLAKRPESRLVLIGEGENRKKLELYARELGITDRVLFYGRTAEPETLFSAMDVFLLPSLFEGLSVSAVEAQTSGLPTICAEGLSEEVRLWKHTCFLPLSIPVWADRLATMVDLPDRSKAAVTVASSGFDIHLTAHEIYTVFLGEMP